jgi:hypothetical protein
VYILLLGDLYPQVIKLAIAQMILDTMSETFVNPDRKHGNPDIPPLSKSRKFTENRKLKPGFPDNELSDGDIKDDITPLNLKRKLNDDNLFNKKSEIKKSDNCNNVIDILVHLCGVQKIETAYDFFHNNNDNNNNHDDKEIDIQVLNNAKIIDILICANKIIEAIEVLNLKDSIQMIPIVNGTY